MSRKLDWRTMQFLQNLDREGAKNVNKLDPSLAWSLTERGYCQARTARSGGTMAEEVVVLELTEAGKLALAAQEKDQAHA